MGGGSVTSGILGREPIPDQEYLCSLHQADLSDVCEAVPTSSFWAPDGNKLLEVGFRYLFNLIGGPEQEFQCCFTDGL